MIRNSPYKVLGCSPMSSEDEVKRRYRELSKYYHPDNPSTGNALKFMEVKRAFEELKKYGFKDKKGSWTHKTLFTIKRR